MTIASPPRPDLAAYNEVTRMEPGTVVAELVEILGRKITALLAGVKDTRTVDAWVAGREAGRKFDVERLRLALRIAKMLRTRDDKRVVQAWFMGLNPQLGDRSPARILRDGDPAMDAEGVVSAARAFLIGG
ncbi:MAG TPA: hypothetical protein VFB22_07795 [Candidatus Baltobacteraceae bacterium]|nr:hypothetical protein [Candidatus Baltobacteraceae bacterium]